MFSLALCIVINSLLYNPMAFLITTMSYYFIFVDFLHSCSQLLRCYDDDVVRLDHQRKEVVSESDLFSRGNNIS